MEPIFEQRPVSRRKALYLLTILVGGAALARFFPNQVESGGGEPADVPPIIPGSDEEVLGVGQVFPPALAYGLLVNEYGQVSGDTLEILQTNPDFSYTVRHQSQTLTIPMKSVQVTDGYPFPNAQRFEGFGMRVGKEESYLMAKVEQCGAGIVRIAGDIEDLGEDSQFERAIIAAEAQGLRPLVVFNPVFPRDDNFIREKVTRVTSSHPSVVLELGNEWDNSIVPFWTGDLTSFAHFIKVAIDAAWSVRPDQIVVIGALVNTDNTPLFLDALEHEGVSITNPNIHFAVHAYLTASSVRERSTEIKTYLQAKGIMSPLWMTEVGIDSYNAANVYDRSWELIAMLQACKDSGISFSVVHQLMKDPVEKYGLTEDGKTFLPAFFAMQILAQLQGV